jgi:hypothetical protein
MDGWIHTFENNMVLWCDGFKVIYIFVSIAVGPEYSSETIVGMWW